MPLCEGQACAIRRGAEGSEDATSVFEEKNGIADVSRYVMPYIFLIVSPLISNQRRIDYGI
jgi:hypothetical protein